jgi:transcriptional regulator with XRE-family HTH domain
MTFQDLQSRLLTELRLRVRSGAVTERGLARDTGISQPHLHHVLKGKRLLSVERADEVLRRLDLDLLHLITTEELREFLTRR